MVQEKYRKVSNFNGITMDISNDSQLLLKEVISSRLNEDNVDRITEILSSNCGEQYFGFIARYTQGKRLNSILCVELRAVSISLVIYFIRLVLRMQK